MNEKKTTQKGFALRRIYIKDVSFESPRAPYSFNTAWKPAVDMQIHNSHKPLEGDMYESTLKISLTGKLEDKTTFIIEIVQAGNLPYRQYEQQREIRNP